MAKAFHSAAAPGAFATNQPDSPSGDFIADRPWRILLKLYWPERRWVFLAMTAVRMPMFVPVFLLFVPLIWVIRRYMTVRLQRYNQDYRWELEGMNSLVLGMISMIPITRAHAAEDAVIERVETQFTHVRAAARRFDQVAGLFGASGWVALMLFNLGGLPLGAWLSYKKILPLNPGDLVLLAFYFNMIMTAMMQLNAMLPINSGRSGAPTAFLFVGTDRYRKRSSTRRKTQPRIGRHRRWIGNSRTSILPTQSRR